MQHRNFLGQELDSIFTDIYPDAVKIGMVSDKELIKVIAAKLRQYEAKNIVVDPVMVATSGAKLISDDAADILKEELFPLASVLTPNIPEAEELIGRKITSAEEMIDAAKEISEKYHCAVLCKGGHNLNDANDLLYADGVYRWFNGKRIDNPNTHGTGCTLSSAIASNLAKGFSLEESVERAKEYISGALAAMLNFGKGSGPMDHGFAIKKRIYKRSERLIKSPSLYILKRRNLRSSTKHDLCGKDSIFISEITRTIVLFCCSADGLGTNPKSRSLGGME